MRLFENCDQQFCGIITSRVIDRPHASRGLFEYNFPQPFGSVSTMTSTSTQNPSAAPGAAPPPDTATPGRGLLLTVLTGVFITTLDFFIVNVAIPSAQADLAATAAEIQWIVAGYGLAYGVGLITGGRLGDL